MSSSEPPPPGSPRLRLPASPSVGCPLISRRSIVHATAIDPKVVAHAPIGDYLVGRPGRSSCVAPKRRRVHSRPWGLHGRSRRTSPCQRNYAAYACSTLLGHPLGSPASEPNQRTGCPALPAFLQARLDRAARVALHDRRHPSIEPTPCIPLGFRCLPSPRGLACLRRFCSSKTRTLTARPPDGSLVGSGQFISAASEPTPAGTTSRSSTSRTKST